MTDSVISNSPALWAKGSQVSMGPNFDIRILEAEDLLNVAQLLCESFYPPTSNWHWALPVLRIGIYQDLRTRFITQSPKHACFVAVQTIQQQGHSPASKIVGTVEVTLRSLWLVQRPVPYISNLAVSPNHRRQGIAQHLLFACEQVAIGWQADFLYLNVLKTNVAAQRLYTKAKYCPEQQSPWPRIGRSKRLLLRKHLCQEAPKKRQSGQA
jgi:ribosomal protein S18 acetylase RimI-like enzyme